MAMGSVRREGGRTHQLEFLLPCSFPVGERIGKAASQGEEFKCHLLNSLNGFTRASHVPGV